MPKKHSDDTIYIKKDGKYVAVGKWFDRDFLGFGNWFVSNDKYRKGYHYIGAAPDPDFISLETGVEECRDQIREDLHEIIDEHLKGNTYPQNYYTVDKIIQIIRKTFLKKKQQMLDSIQN